ncbi:Peroxidase [Mycena venus]|uniref:Peroxidase n=1 Tax=Mycena venus TaxID=2733690 RepID=A0A8H6YQR4_9AGAR|nr:Peroxidase [Mycena venus]
MFGFTLFAYVAGTTAYVWPSPKLDALEAQRWDQDDTISGFASFLQPCDFFIAGNEDGTPTGRANGPDWIRTAYHDMATHNVADGTGGLDGSIRFSEEQSRSENAGTGFSNTVAVFASFTTRHVSLADLIAIGAVTAIENCNGPQIDFRGGRVDSAAPDAPGVPEPQQDLQAHIDSFARQGFTQTEMISLIACGHSFGGVEHKAFPDIVPDLKDPNNTLSVAHFDSTFVNFDNKVATEYISGTTQNPLVVGANDTTNSDKRIFASDRNVTMKSFADSPDLFTSTCATLFARMLDTVPSDVELTDVIEPLPIKPATVVLLLDGDKLQFSGFVRLFNQSDDSDQIRLVNLLWDDRSGETHNATLPFDRTSSAMGGRVKSAWYAFNHTADGNSAPLAIDPAAGITTMRFEVNGNVEDQGGVGFAVQDGYAFSTSSCMTSADPPKGRFDIAVRNGFNPTRVFLEREVKDSVNRTTVEETDITPPTQPVAADEAYSLWSVDVSDANSYTIGAEVNGDKFSTIETHSVGDLNPCRPQRRLQHKRRSSKTF